MTSQEWMDSREELFTRATSELPMLWKLTRQPDVDMTLDALFEEGLAWFLDGIATTRELSPSARSRRPRAAPPRARSRAASPPKSRR